MRIDAHQHYWRPERGDYPWMGAAPDCLRRAFGPAEMAPLLQRHGIDATILVQAAPTVDETHYLLGIADSTPSVAGVVGWIDFEQPQQRAVLERLRAHPRLCGIRPMVQDLPDDDWVLRPAIAWAFAALQELGLPFDALGFPRHAKRFLALAEAHPGLRIILDHGLKPEIARRDFDGWAGDMRAIARNTQALCKLSGLATEAAAGWSRADLAPYIDHLLETFGPSRLVWGSDWPVSTSAVEYGAWFDLCLNAVRPFGEDATRRVFGANALDFYRIDPTTLLARLPSARGTGVRAHNLEGKQ